MQFRLGELFCGPGGLAWAAKNATIPHNPEFHITHAWATDYDKDSCSTYRRNICPNSPETVLQHDIRSLDYGVLSAVSQVDAVAFGFPCNDFSIVGEQRGMDGDFGPLYKFGVKALSEFRPMWFLAENVGGLRTSNAGNALEMILEALFDQGYSIYPNLYRFEEYGVPQARHRIIIVGIRNDQDIVFRVPSPREYCSMTCKEAIENPPIDEDAPNHEFTRQAPTVIQRLKHIKPGENAFTANLPRHLQLNVRGARISQIYKKLDPDKPAYTVTGSGGGGTHVYHWKEPRALTNRERARLQTFPDEFVFCGSKESVRKQIGMAVPPAGAKIIFEAVLKSFAKCDYPYVSANMNPLLQPDHIGSYNRVAPRESQQVLFGKDVLKKTA